MEEIQFKAYKQESRFLDPYQNFTPTSRLTEIREDPLTGKTSRILDTQFKVERLDVDAIVAQARSGVDPFAPGVRESITPRFLEEDLSSERFSAGEALVVPNLFPYDRFSAITIISKADYIPVSGFSNTLLDDAFTAGIAYLKHIQEKNPDLQHFSVNWNYMPLAGGSLVHPHHQLIASPILPNYLREVRQSLKKYEGDYYADLLRAEEARGERWVGRLGSVTWITGYAPMGHLDIMGVFEDKRSLSHLTREDYESLSQGLLKILRFLDSEDFISFNFALYMLEGVENFTVHCRLTPRFILSSSLLTSDVNYFEVLHGEPLAFYFPEVYAQRLSSTF